MKKWVFAAAAALIIELLSSVAYAAPAVSAGSAIVMHTGGEVVFEKNADERMLIASTTKLMTAIVAIENADFEDSVAILPEHCAVEGSSMYLKAGQSRSVYELLLGLMLASGNDAALALSQHVGGDTVGFTAMMNEKASSLGMDNTHFSNPHGLNAEEHYSSARDLALLMDYCMQNRDFAELAGTKSCEIAGQTFINHNRLLQICPGCLGGKTGYTMLAGRCLVSCCQRGDTRFICVTLSAPNDWNDHCALYDWAFSAYADRDISQSVSFSVPVAAGAKQQAEAVPEELWVFAEKDKEIQVTAELPRFEFAPIQKGDTAGRFTAYIDGKAVAEGKLLYNESVELKI